jgi:hypothetical protein
MYNHGMSYDQSLKISYILQPDINPEVLAEIQLQAIEQRSDEIQNHAAEFKKAVREINDVFDYGDYTLIVAYAQSTPVAYLLASKVQNGIDDTMMINDLYAPREMKIDSKKQSLKDFQLGKTMMKKLEQHLPESIEQIQAKPLEGSEIFYAKNGYRSNGSSLYEKLLNN